MSHNQRKILSQKFTDCYLNLPGGTSLFHLMLAAPFDSTHSVYISTLNHPSKLLYPLEIKVLPKAKLCVHRGTRANRVLRVPLGLVEVHVSMEYWLGHPRL